MEESTPVIAVGSIAGKRQHLSLCGGRVLECHAIGFVSRGRGFYEDRDRGRIPITAPVAICQFPGIWHCFDPEAGETWDEVWVMFHGERLDSALDAILPREPLVSCGENAHDVHDAFRQLHAAWFFDSPRRRARVPYHLHRIFYELHVARHGRDVPDARDPVERLRQALARHLDKPDIDARALSRLAEASYDRLRREFRQATGVAPKQYFLQLKILRAKELLLMPGMRVGEVARQVGFEDAYYFSRLFRSKTGLSPRAWRETHLGASADVRD